jgi:NAD(P)-dependent dehydrogenase (short-subunit alcohol dehydrogenase family)
MAFAAKVVIVTGANSGIGYETAKALLQASKPYHILLGSRSREKAETAIASLHKECPGATNKVDPLPVDLNSDQSIEQAFEQVKANPGRVDALINNAGVHQPIGRDS